MMLDPETPVFVQDERQVDAIVPKALTCFPTDRQCTHTYPVFIENRDTPIGQVIGKIR
jgi:hypothetical protein